MNVDDGAPFQGLFGGSHVPTPHGGDPGDTPRSPSNTSRKRQQGSETEPMDDIERAGFERRVDELDASLNLPQAQAARFAQLYRAQTESLK